MDEKYLNIVDFTLKREGGLSNRSADRGGYTYRGITQKYFGNWAGWKIIDELGENNLDSNDELDRLVKEFYYDNFYLHFKLDKVVDADICLAIFDFCVNAGNNGIKKLQKLLGCSVDGIIGNKTISLVNKYNDKAELLKEYLEARREFYRAIVASDSSQGVNLKGWLNRVDSLESVTSRV